jgi:SET domain-containing protein
MSDYEEMLADIGMTQEFFDKVIEMCDKVGIVKTQTDMYYKGESEIEGVGIFACKNIKQGDVIGLGSIDRINKTLLGRYTNHSDNKNAMFYYLANDDQVMIAVEDISKDEEIVIDYRDNLLNSLAKMMAKIQSYEKCI